MRGARSPRAQRRERARPRTRAIGQTTGVNAVVMVSSRVYAQVARQLPRRAAAASPRGCRTAATAARAISGSRTARTAVPIRPPASAPVAAGRKA